MGMRKDINININKDKKPTVEQRVEKLEKYKEEELEKKIQILERRIRKLGKRVNGGSAMSKILSELIGQEVILNISREEVRCRVLDVDEDWIKILIPAKKNGIDVTITKPITDLKEITYLPKAALDLMG